MNILSYFKKLFLVFFLITLSGCTHKIDITPNNDKIINLGYTIEKKDYNVGYYIENIDLIIVSEGGGGDKVSYLAYKDTESAFRKVLVKHFNKVFLINDINNKEFISEKNINLIFSYKIHTYSTSNSIQVFSPTEFIITLECRAINKEGITIWQKTLKGKGSASPDELKNDLALTGKRATEDVFKKLLYELNTEELRKVYK